MFVRFFQTRQCHLVRWLLWTSLIMHVDGKSRPIVKMVIVAGDANVEGFASIGNLRQLVTTGSPAPYQHLWNATKSEWTVRRDVFVTYDHDHTANWTHGPLTVGGFGADSGSFGPELQLGHVLGEAYDEPVIIVKTGWQARSLAKDFAPPAVGSKLGGGFQWYRMILNIQKTADSLHEILGPSYRHSRPDIVGFIWWQGYTDFANTKMTKDYGDNLKKFLHAVRTEFKQPYMSLLVAGLGGQGLATKDKKELAFRQMQEQVVKEHFSNYSAVFVPTAPYVKKQPAIKDYTFYNGNAPTMLEISQALAMAVLELDGSKQRGGDGSDGWMDSEPDVLASSFETFMGLNMMMMIGIVGVGVFFFVCIMRYGGDMNRTWNVAFSPLRPHDDLRDCGNGDDDSNNRRQKGIESKQSGRRGTKADTKERTLPEIQ